MKYRIGGKDGRPSLGKISKVSLADAQAAARDYFAMVARKINPSVERAKAVVKVNDTVEGYIDDFIKYLRDDKKRSAAHVDGVTRTLRKYAAALHAFNPADVDRAMVAKQLKRIKNESGASTADHCRSHLSGFFLGSW